MGLGEVEVVKEREEVENEASNFLSFEIPVTSHIFKGKCMQAEK
jgi:hypothetical protein